jgi:2-polyprenyl-3-methyl-5-hydroxy-6-metoxy-1,4-benzoquinol methylase
MSRVRERQLAYSERQALMLDDASRRAKAAKIAAVIRHFLDRRSLDGLTVLDVGCSGGIIADELHRHGAEMLGVDIDRPGLAKAHAQFAHSAGFLCADSERLPLRNQSIDVVICNHVYEHVVDPERLFAELRRVVRPSGLLYLGLGNRLGVLEQHYRLPFLSWLPRPLAHRYVRMFGRASHYHEAFRTWSGLRRLCAGLYVWDYTYALLSDPQTFAAGDVVPSWATRTPAWLLKAARPVVPTYIWIATPDPSHPLGPPTPISPELVVQGSTAAARSSADT